MSETDNDKPDLDPKKLVEDLAHHIKQTSDLQVRLLLWSVREEADFIELLVDVNKLKADVDDMITTVIRERNYRRCGDA